MWRVLITAVQPRPRPALRRPGGFEPELRWRRVRSVALRPEPFGALGTRKLSFLSSEALVRVVETLADHPSAQAAIDACDVPVAQRPAYMKALADLARSQMIEPRS